MDEYDALDTIDEAETPAPPTAADDDENWEDPYPDIDIEELEELLVTQAFVASVLGDR